MIKTADRLTVPTTLKCISVLGAEGGGGAVNHQLLSQ